MNRGDLVRVTLLGGEKATRCVWAVTEQAVMVCTEVSYRQSQQSGTEPVTVGFRYEFLEPLPLVAATG